MSEAQKKRIHLIETPNDVRLVRAATKNQAIRHAVSDLIKCRVASQDDLVAHLNAGVKVEDAGAVEAEAEE